MQVVEKKRIEYIASQKDRMTIEKIEQKELKDHTYRVNQVEQSMIDQVATSGYIRQRNAQ